MKELATAVFDNYLTLIWAQVLNSLQDLAKETSHKDIDRLI